MRTNTFQKESTRLRALAAQSIGARLRFFCLCLFEPTAHRSMLFLSELAEANRGHSGRGGFISHAGDGRYGAIRRSNCLPLSCLVKSCLVVSCRVQIFRSPTISQKHSLLLLASEFVSELCLHLHARKRLGA